MTDVPEDIVEILEGIKKTAVANVTVRQTNDAGPERPMPLNPNPVPEHIRKTAEGIENFGIQWADAIEAAAKKQLDADTKRYEDSMALANRIRQDAQAEASHVTEYALRTLGAGLEIKGVFERLNGKHPDPQQQSDA